jgi:hypothetical protein
MAKAYQKVTRTSRIKSTNNNVKKGNKNAKTRRVAKRKK